MPIRIAYYLPRMEQIGNRSQLQLLRQQLPADDFQSRLFGFVASRQQASQSDADECLIYRSHAVDPVALLRLAKALKAWRADIVHVWGPEDLGVEVRWPLKRAASLRMATLHNPPARGGRWIPAAAQRWLASCQQVTGTSHSVLKQLPAAIELGMQSSSPFQQSGGCGPRSICRPHPATCWWQDRMIAWNSWSWSCR